MPPFVLCLLDSGEVLLFPDLRTLESAIEGIDVRNREYLAYDSNGFVVDLTVDNLDLPRAELSELERAAELRGWILDNYHSASGITDKQTLPQIIDSLKAIYRYGD